MILWEIAALRLDTLQAIPYGIAALHEFFVCFFPESARLPLRTQVDSNFSVILLAALLSCFRQRLQTQKPPARSVGRCNVAARFTTGETCLIVKSTLGPRKSSVSKNWYNFTDYSQSLRASLVSDRPKPRLRYLAEKGWQLSITLICIFLPTNVFDTLRSKDALDSWFVEVICWCRISLFFSRAHLSTSVA